MNPKVCFVSLINLYAIPYLIKYVNLLDCDYDIIYWDRIGIVEPCDAKNIYVLEHKIRIGCSKLTKLLGYIRFRYFAEKILKDNNYNCVILLCGNVAVLLNRVLLDQYKNKYIIDIRDYFKENNRFYFNIEKKLIENSKLAVISSKAFTNFLPSYPYAVVHNTPAISEKQFIRYKEKRRKYLNSHTGKPIVLSFIGNVRYLEQDKKILKYFGNDDRFLIRYIGIGSNILKNFSEKEDIKNTYFHDWFEPEKTLSFYSDTDFILNLYGNGTHHLDYALSNKLYFAATLGIPILVCPRTYMEEVAVANGFGVTVNLDDKKYADHIVKYYEELDFEKLKLCCKRFCETVERENNVWETKVKEIWA